MFITVITGVVKQQDALVLSGDTGTCSLYFRKEQTFKQEVKVCKYYYLAEEEEELQQQTLILSTNTADVKVIITVN